MMTEAQVGVLWLQMSGCHGVLATAGSREPGTGQILRLREWVEPLDSRPLASKTARQHVPLTCSPSLGVCQRRRAEEAGTEGHEPCAEPAGTL